MLKRESGVLMHISSLPGNYGIGSFEENQHMTFVDFLVRTKQTWQILPLELQFMEILHINH